MVFNSFEFILFFSVVYAVYLALARRLWAQNALLLVGSYYFYGCWDWRFLSLIVLSTIIDYVCGRLLDRRTASSEAPRNYKYSNRTRKWILGISLVSNLGILAFFKYFDFFVESGAAFLSAIGLPLELSLLHLILPVGISFYTFQTLSYTIDVYRGELRAERNLLTFSVFVAFFPQLVAGPILRAKSFLPQVASPRDLSTDRCYSGFALLFWGLFKKVVIADNLAHLVDPVFSSGEGPYNLSTVLLGVYAFTIQIYCDFSGYSDMARGIARMMGFDIPLNFNLPYFSSSPSEFWHRWHISLSSWLRDYLYIPLGGNRKGPRRTQINLLLTMALGGLWHGAAWTFVFWGVYHGLLLMIYRILKPVTDWLGERGGKHLMPARRLVAVTIFFHFTCLGWLIFRAESIDQIGAMLGGLINITQLTWDGYGSLLICIAPLALMQAIQWTNDDLEPMYHWPAPIRGLVYCLMFYALVLFAGDYGKPFIYFQF